MQYLNHSYLVWDFPNRSIVEIFSFPSYIKKLCVYPEAILAICTSGNSQNCLDCKYTFNISPTQYNRFSPNCKFIFYFPVFIYVFSLILFRNEYNRFTCCSNPTRYEGYSIWKDKHPIYQRDWKYIQLIHYQINSCSYWWWL